ncbi:sugar ABC transporter permease [Streptacidiphilus jiangxiensis]|uniref:Arabinogalactan oligomer / maltooligosaccharide transport system permease protein n=1 Tax=Streptacidiphilus jiangxiensis TaxID=235985 RepID=A0A1H7X1X0_STRJI|nr:ABC transporter permease subunit [Streptacidiphilus jiangxiensis]SEM27595.1 arabinogalactan oligomer / maltooligosaccharide transport system permease protein [Streptacidiphilus jiangxiensis]
MSTKKTRGRGERGPLASAGLHSVLAVAAFVAAFPVAWVAYISLGAGEFDYQHPNRIAAHPSLANYDHVVNHTDFFTWLGNSTLIAAGTTVVGVLVAASAGYAVSRIRFLGRGTLMYTFLLTQMFPVSVLMVPMYKILADTKLLDTYGGLILVYCTTAVPYCAWLLKGYFDTIPVEIDEAGRIDGLNPFGTFWRLIIPLARPGLAVAAFYTFLTAWGEVAFASFFLLSSNHYTLAVGLQTFVSQFNSQWNYMAATGVLIAIPAAAFFYLVQKNLVTGLTAGGTKG